MSLVSSSAIHYAKIDLSASGDATIVPATTARKVRVLSIDLIAGGAVAATFKSGSTDVTGAIPLTANQAFQTAREWGCFETESGEALVLNLSASEVVAGFITYE